MKSRVVKRSVFLAGHRTSVSLEEEFVHRLSEIAAGRHLRVNELINEIGTKRQSGTLSSALRLFVLEHYRSQYASRPRTLLRRRCRKARNRVGAPD
jgi:predicted DNA-binding ribbon-helix-helix protein